MIDDQATFTEALAMSFDMLSNLEVIGRATSGTTGVDIALELQPDLVLCDYRIPGESNGVECAARLRSNGFDGQIVILTGFASPEVRAEAELLDDVQVISKDLSVADIIESLTPSVSSVVAAETAFVPLTRLAPVESSDSDLSVRVFAVVAMIIAVAVCALLATLSQATQEPTSPAVMLERPFVILDGTTPTKVSIKVGESSARSFTPVNLPATIAIDATAGTNIEVVIDNPAGTNSCSIGANKLILVADAYDPVATCAVAIP